MRPASAALPVVPAPMILAAATFLRRTPLARTIIAPSVVAALAIAATIVALLSARMLIRLLLLAGLIARCSHGGRALAMTLTGAPVAMMLRGLSLMAGPVAATLRRTLVTLATAARTPDFLELLLFRRAGDSLRSLNGSDDIGRRCGGSAFAVDIGRRERRGLFGDVGHRLGLLRIHGG